MKIFKLLLGTILTAVLINLSVSTEFKTSSQTKSKFALAQAILDRYQAFGKKAEAYKSGKLSSLIINRF